MLKFDAQEALLDDKKLEEMLENFFLEATLHEEANERRTHNDEITEEISN